MLSSIASRIAAPHSWMWCIIWCTSCLFLSRAPLAAREATYLSHHAVVVIVIIVVIVVDRGGGPPHHHDGKI